MYAPIVGGSGLCAIFFPMQLVAHNYTIHRTRLQTAHLNSEAENLNTHPTHIRSSHLPHQAGKLISVLVNLLHGQSA